MSASYGVLIFTMVFISVVGWFLNESGYGTYTLINPTIFLVGQALLTASVVLANTPALKGVAVGLWGTWIFVYLLSLNLTGGIGVWVYSIVLVPCFISIGMILLEVGKG